MLKWLRGFGTAIMLVYSAAMTGLSYIAIKDVDELKKELNEDKGAEE